MIEQLQSLMKALEALEAGSYKSSQISANQQTNHIDPQNCLSAKTNEKEISERDRYVKKERQSNDPYRYYFGDHIWEHYK